MMNSPRLFSPLLAGRQSLRVILGFGLGACSQLMGATYLIDFGSSNLTTGTDGSGNVWNNLTPDTTDGAGDVALVDTTGSGAEGLNMNYLYPVATPGSNFEMNSNENGLSGPFSNLGLLDVSSAFGDTLWSNGSGQTPSLTFENLDANTLYTFTLFAYRAQSGRTTDFRLTGLAVDQENGYRVDTSNTGNGVIVTLSGRADAANELLLELLPGTGDYAYIGALQIETSPIPEPTGAALLSLGAISLLLGSRKRR
ncbi:MAG: PEP-CTERM sorting domain-containing protein [Verrucomicrobiales bacterium]